MNLILPPVPPSETGPPPEDKRPGLIHDVIHKTHLWAHALVISRFYRFGETGNLMYTVGKSILEGAVLYTMFSMAQTEYKVAAVLGVMTKYIYPGITFVSSVKVSSFVDHLERFTDKNRQLQKLIGGVTLVGIGQALGALMLVLCYPPFFTTCFDSGGFSRYLLIVLYLLHHIFDGSAQVAEGRIWFKLIEIKLRHGNLSRISENFWGIHAMSQNIQLMLGLILLWGTTLITGLFRDRLDAGVMWTIVLSGTLLTAFSKFTLPLAWHLRLRHAPQATPPSEPS
ncbi:hypothetical protein Pcar_0490 [Syntrophotalea carbinolica DSM 2380]|uniref:Uncharacterized protein n=1 Tax=Syntrophotalea carbinolica (strain DSM 2380 / NBRC 103641 / GraBd1) TaxID=338963 RepID=Q3A794_SYNC1|nr:hypothetical protein [Syntrophotalea carbinolica]ABA87750.1 hypothetical protein Pcar_0490 [Syntrophotalea carbinolica DSM 2380]